MTATRTSWNRDDRPLQILVASAVMLNVIFGYRERFVWHRPMLRRERKYRMVFPIVLDPPLSGQKCFLVPVIDVYQQVTL